MFATENGPDAHAPEELNLIEQGNHYGFPYQFANWTQKAYSHTPDAPAGLEFTLPIPNLGPDGGFKGEPIYSFDPHSCPGDIVSLGDDFPENYRGSLVLTRFGNFIREPNPSVGFDLLQVRLSRDASGKYQAHVHTFMEQVGRPLALHQSGSGRLYLCEYSRAIRQSESYSMSGRLLELSPQ